MESDSDQHEWLQGPGRFVVPRSSPSLVCFYSDPGLHMTLLPLLGGRIYHRHTKSSAVKAWVPECFGSFQGLSEGGSPQRGMVQASS